MYQEDGKIVVVVRDGDGKGLVKVAWKDIVKAESYTETTEK